MGCWSESCAISGMEIQNTRPCYAALIEKSKYEERWNVVVPPVRGEYDDYGGIDLTEDMPFLGLKIGTNWRPMEAKRGLPVYIDAEVFDFSPDLEREFQYDGIRTIGDARDAYIAKIQAGIDKQIARRKEFSKTSTESEEGRISLDILCNLAEVFGYGEGKIVVGAQSLAERMISTGNHEFTDFFRFYGRAFVLLVVMMELRKPLAPVARGPQHGGEQALIPFYRKVLELAEERKRNWE